MIPEDFHDWRKRAKDLRYQLEMLEPGLPGEFTEIRKHRRRIWPTSSVTCTTSMCWPRT